MKERLMDWLDRLRARRGVGTRQLQAEVDLLAKDSIDHRARLAALEAQVQLILREGRK